MKKSAFAFSVCLMLCAAMSAQTLRYSLRDLGTFNGVSAEAMAVNTAGQVVGRYSSGGRMNCFFWSTATFAPTSTWTSKSPTGSCVAYGINDAGQMSGTITLADGTTSNAFRATRDYKRGTVSLTYLAGPYGLGTYGSGLNASGDVIGTSNGQFGHIAALFKGDGTYTEVGSDCADSWGTAVGGNVPFSMCPFVNPGDGSLVQNAQAILNGARVFLGLAAIPPFQREQANAVDSSGMHPVGFDYSQDGISHATQWQWDPSQHLFHHVFLTIISSWATGVSDDNWIVGQLTDNSHPFVMVNNPNCSYPVGLASLLDSSGAGWTVLTANGINRNHQIVGSASFNGVTHAVLLTSNGGTYCL